MIIDIAGMIDHTLLKPDVTRNEIEQLCLEGRKYNFASVCMNPVWVKFCREILTGSGIKICTVSGFPLGASTTAIKAKEAEKGIEDGADEIDMVMNIGALKSGDIKSVEEDIRAIKRACRSNTILKVIIETSLLTEEEKILACEISKKAGADFVKTSTGFSTSGATVEDIILMRRVVGPQMGVKASGGITDFNKAVALIQAGANRLGCGSSVAVITGAKPLGTY